jgi:hypothetical protein
MTDPVPALNVFIGAGMLFVAGVIAVIIMEAVNE